MVSLRRPSVRTAFGLLAALLLVLAMVAPAAAAKPQRIVIPFGTPEDDIATSEFVSAVCGYTIDATTRSGHLIIHLFERSTGVVEIDNYNTVRMVFTNPENQKRYVVQIDAGPDIVRVGRDGRVTLAITGHSTTGSGVIGRTVVDLDTGEVISMRGKVLGDFWAKLCTALA